MLVSVTTRSFPWPVGVCAKCVCPGGRPYPLPICSRSAHLQSVLFLWGERRDEFRICGVNSISGGHLSASGRQEIDAPCALAPDSLNHFRMRAADEGLWKGVGLKLRL